MAALSGWKRIRNEYIYITDITKRRQCVRESEQNADLYTRPPFRLSAPRTQSHIKKKRKFNKTHIEWLLDDTRKSLSPTKLKVLFNEHFQKKISTTTISKILRGTYV